jgi:very-short-patch-repair endonuclease
LPTARDRDRLRQLILEGLGWTLHRVWSTDWWNDPDREFKKLEMAINKQLIAHSS